MNVAINFELKKLKKENKIYLDEELTFGKKKGICTKAILLMENLKDKGIIFGQHKRTSRSTTGHIKMEKEAQIKKI
jgi:hypothetical protein